MTTSSTPARGAYTITAVPSGETPRDWGRLSVRGWLVIVPASQASRGAGSGSRGLGATRRRRRPPAWPCRRYGAAVHGRLVKRGRGRWRKARLSRRRPTRKVGTLSRALQRRFEVYAQAWSFPSKEVQPSNGASPRSLLLEGAL